mmetsp:Transcript_23765/g.60192  ORF Transcript_23765/g.60192 Transcript_23765/m.60192 type:complete len:155 (-) Transcript_23765:172-636(-)
MRILDKSGGALTNFEVFRILDEEQTRAASNRELLSGARRTAPHVSLTAQRTLMALRTELMFYLKQSPCADQTEEQIAEFLQRIAGLQLTTAEIMQCINLRPTSLVEIYLIVDECDQRLGSVHCQQLLEAIEECFPQGPDAEQDDALQAAGLAMT